MNEYLTLYLDPVVKPDHMILRVSHEGRLKTIDEMAQLGWGLVCITPINAVTESWSGFAVFRREGQ